MNYQLTLISLVLIYSSAHLMVLTLLLIVTFNTCSMFLFCMYSHNVALEA